MQLKTIIFDLDGTLIDSSKSILAGFDAAFRAEGLRPNRPLTAEVIGPPLKETLAALSGLDDPQLLDRLVGHFKAHYDTEGYKETTVFEGITTLLQRFENQAVPMHIATNKRLHPTTKILEHLGWQRYFGSVFALDYWQPPAANKSSMLGLAMAKLSLVGDQTLYVGDRKEDGEAADGNGLHFALAEWGYGSPEGAYPEHWEKFKEASRLTDWASRFLVD